MLRRIRLDLVLLLLLVVGCGDDASSELPLDASRCNEVDIAACIDAPEPTALPAFFDWSCPPGWSSQPAFVQTTAEQGDGDPPPPTICEPPVLPTACALGTMPTPKSSTCQPVGDPCPAGEWPVGLPVSGVIYVQPGGTGDGSSTASPLDSIATAINVAPTGGTIALAKGTYQELIEIPRELTLWGACVASTTIESISSGEVPGIVEITTAGGAHLKNLRIAGARPGIWSWGNAAPTRLTGVWIDGAAGGGVIFTDGSSGGSLSQVVIVDMLPRAADGALGRGITVDVGQVTISDLWIERALEFGIYARTDAATVTVTGAVIRDTRPTVSNQERGRALQARDGASLSVTRAVIDGNRDIAVRSSGTGAVLSLRFVVVKNTIEQASDMTGGIGLSVEFGASAVVESSLFSANRQIAVVAVGADSTLSLTDVVIRDTRNAGAAPIGRGVELSQQASVVLERVVIDNSSSLGVLVTGAGTNLTGTDLYVRRTQPGIAIESGRGMVVNDGASATLGRVTLEANHSVGLGVAHAGTTVVATDLTIRRTAADPVDDGLGHGLHIQDGASLTLIRALLSENLFSAVAIIDPNTLVTATDLVVRNTGSRVLDGQFGRGLTIADGARIDMTRVLFERNRGSGFGAWGAATILIASHVVVRNTLGEEQNSNFGRGIEITDAQVSLTRALLDGNREVGMMVFGRTATVNVIDCAIRGTRPNDGDGFYGHGLIGFEDSTVRLDGCEVSSSHGIALTAFDASIGVIAGRIADNTVGVHTMGSTSLAEVDALPSALPGRKMLISRDTIFAGNTTRVGTGVIPLPGPSVAF